MAKILEMKNSLIQLSMLLLIAAATSSCSKDETTDASEIERNRYVSNYINIVKTNYSDCYATAQQLANAVSSFTANPTESGLNACKNAWLAARIPYGQTEAFRFYGGPIDDADGPEGLINAWPMDEAFIDYVQGSANSGIINDPVNYPQITKEVLEQLNESISETSIFTGYHAIEFLLWGQDLSASGPGNRPYTDFVTGTSATAPNGDRRCQYLLAVTELLLDNLNDVRSQWDDNQGYPKTFIQGGTLDCLNKIFTSIGELSKGELAGERMIVAVDSEDQENEHSCFSDNTVTDIRMNYQGIKNLLLGSYTSPDGTVTAGYSLIEFGLKYYPEATQKVSESITACDAAIAAIPSPFDQAILYNQNEILTAADELKKLSDRCTDLGFQLGAYN